MNRFRAIFRRDWQLSSSMPLSLCYEWGQALAGLLSFYFISKLTPGIDYFRFVALGLVGSWAMSTGLSLANETVQMERAHGTLEAILLSRTPLATLLAARLATQTLWIAAKTAFALTVGHLLGIPFSPGAILVIACVMMLTLLFFFGAGLLFAGAGLAFRDAGPLEGLTSWVLRFGGGVYFPVRLLPAPLRALSAWNPLAQALILAREAGHPSPGRWATLLAASILSLILGAGCFGWGLRRGKQTGRLRLLA